ncbi:MAG TPA: T9SS type A sorting domain-containing protein, partial [Flavobacteriales bacterium]|nr:T9SS type A sorting domain-containing protein [Flavobacteriales bacterium]
HGRTATAHPGSSTGARGSAPANDECAAAEALTVHTDAECATLATAGNNGGSTTTTGDPACDASDTGYQDVWYSFNSGANEQVNITLTPSVDMTDWAFVVTTSCASTDELACEIVPDGPINVVVTPNTDYIIRVYSNLQYGVGSTFTLCVAGGGEIPEPPANDDCAGATAHNLSVGGSVDISGNNVGATDGEGFGFNSAWESFTTTACANVTIDFCGTSPAFTDFVPQLGNSCPLDAAVNASFQTECPGGGNTVLTYMNLPAGTYYIPVLQNVTSAGPYTIHVAAAACAPPPANDECAGAILVTSHANCTDIMTTTAGGTESMPAIECNLATGLADDDVWYSFMATNVDQTISVQGYSSFDAVIELFSGTCGSLTSISCGDNTYPPTGVEDTGDSLSYSGLTVGETYYFRVYDYAQNTAFPAFNLCVQEGLLSSLSVGETTATAAFTVFPNPSNGDITIAYNAAGGAVGVQLLDMTGRVVYNGQRNLSKGQTLSLALAGKLAPGQYLLRLDTPDGRKEQRIAVQ